MEKCAIVSHGYYYNEYLNHDKYYNKMGKTSAWSSKCITTAICSSMPVERIRNTKRMVKIWLKTKIFT